MQLKQLLTVLMLLHSACAYTQKPAQLVYKDYQVNRSLKTDSSFIIMLQPYADSLHKQMNTVIGFSNATWYKKQPESALGNFMADCLMLYAAKAFQTDVDAAFVNYGGIRSYLPKGEIKLETIYELMPFDNLVVLQKINGNTLRQLLDLTAYKGGWPCAGITMKIKDKAASDILVNGVPLNDTSVYTIAVSDYLANGGDQCSMLKNIAQQNKNYLFRDALIDYVKSFTSNGKPLSANIENRVTYANE
jgi:2',3'-cyclic-nucleotide 2'-phosphodiesterase (5'-nucleotidase family)